MNRVFPKVLTVALSLAVSLPVSAQEGNERALNDVPSNEGALFLLLPVGAKAVSLGRAMTAMEGTESCWSSPSPAEPGGAIPGGQRHRHGDSSIDAIRETRSRHDRCLLLPARRW